MTPDSDLLSRYAEGRDEAAFAELVRRHVNLVYSVALRSVNGEAALAEDVSQATFAELARKAPELCGRATVAGWLHITTRFLAMRSVRGEQRRRAREQEAIAMSDQTETCEMSWEQLRPLLDEAVVKLDEEDRDAVLLRFFENKSHREVGEVLGVSENGARMRVDRALDKLRAHFARHGVTTTAALLASTLGAHGAAPAPAVFAASLPGKSLSAAGAKAVAASNSGVALYAAIAAITLVIFWTSRSEAPSSILASNNVSVPPVSSSNNTSMATSQNLTRGVLAVAALVATPPAVAQNTTPNPPVLEAPVAAPVAPATAAPANPAETMNALVQSNNQFAVDLYRLFDPKPDENAFFSPYSISTALAMTWAGARAQTAEQMAKVLHIDGLAPADVAAGFLALQQQLIQAETNTASQLAIANSLWVEQDSKPPFLQSYLDLAQNGFGSAVNFADFKNQAQAAVAQINAWVSEKTNNKINNVIHPEDIAELERRNRLIGLILVNTIYFKGNWAHSFQVNATSQAAFHPAEGADKQVALMNRITRANYLDVTDGAAPCQIVSLDYGARDIGAFEGNLNFGRNGSSNASFSFIVILPRAYGDLPVLEKTLNATQLEAWMGKMTSTRVNIYLPKFKIEQSYDLRTGLTALGMTNAFVEPSAQGDPSSADFSGMNGVRQLYIAKAIHQTYVNVDEKGTEAAASTVFLGGVAGIEAPPPPPVLFLADHPFLFLIREDTTGSILFIGRFASPPKPQPAP